VDVPHVRISPICSSTSPNPGPAVISSGCAVPRHISMLVSHASDLRTPQSSIRLSAPNTRAAVIPVGSAVPRHFHSFWISRVPIRESPSKAHPVPIPGWPYFVHVLLPVRFAFWIRPGGPSQIRVPDCQIPDARVPLRHRGCLRCYSQSYSRLR
jgi:hypothetical protein